MRKWESGKMEDEKVRRLIEFGSGNAEVGKNRKAQRAKRRKLKGNQFKEKG
jgi:hypothetical protein